MEARLESLPDKPLDAAPAAGELLRFWEANEWIVGLSAGDAITDRITEQAVLLLTCAEAGDEYGYRSARALFRDAVEDMRGLEALSSILQGS